jgi:hypothetical protein
MYYFAAHYINMDTGEDVTREIVFDGQFLCDDRECFLYAMCRAYDMCESNEAFVSVELIAC